MADLDAQPLTNEQGSRERGAGWVASLIDERTGDVYLRSQDLVVALMKFGHFNVARWIEKAADEMREKKEVPCAQEQTRA